MYLHQKERRGYKAISSLVKYEMKQNQKKNESEVQQKEEWTRGRGLLVQFQH